MQIISTYFTNSTNWPLSTMVLDNYKVPVIIKKTENFKFCPGKSRKNFPNIFQDVATQLIKPAKMQLTKND